MHRGQGFFIWGECWRRYRKTTRNEVQTKANAKSAKIGLLSCSQPWLVRVVAVSGKPSGVGEPTAPSLARTGLGACGPVYASDNDSNDA